MEKKRDLHQNAICRKIFVYFAVGKRRPVDFPCDRDLFYPGIFSEGSGTKASASWNFCCCGTIMRLHRADRGFFGSVKGTGSYAVFRQWMAVWY